MPATNNVVSIPNSQTEKIRLLYEIVLRVSDKSKVDDRIYRRLRSSLMELDSAVKLPSIVIESRDTKLLKEKLSTEYSGPRALNLRRIEVYEMFRHLIDKHNLASAIIIKTELYKSLQAFNFETIHILWQDALDLRESKPYLAITVANSLLETVCIFILESMGTKKTPTGLRRLFRETANTLKLAPDGKSKKY